MDWDDVTFAPVMEIHGSFGSIDGTLDFELLAFLGYSASVPGCDLGFSCALHHSRVEFAAACSEHSRFSTLPKKQASCG